MSLLLAALWGPAACTWVSQSDLDGQLRTVDDDGDGYAANVDCDDRDDMVNPSAAEIWYDGTDNDCGGDDDYDQDGDGFVPDEYAGLTTRGQNSSGKLPSGDCWDEPEGPIDGGPSGSQINPGILDTPYDGLDADCAGNDDYDQDGDGYVPDGYGGLLTWPGDHGDLPEGDCADDDATTNLGATDVWYDGVDSDCGGNDDFDQDLDGYVPDEYQGLPTANVSTSGGLPGRDCDDTNPAANPGALEVWYNGVDDNCLGDEDYDQDGDGWVPFEYRGLPTEYVVGSGGLPHGDCDDTDATANPDGIEIIGDVGDHNCDGNDDAFTLLEADGPAAVGGVGIRWGGSSTSLYLGVAAAQLSDGVASGYDGVMAFEFDPLDPTAGPVDAFDMTMFGDPGSNEVSRGIAFAVDETYVMASTATITSASQRSVQIGLYRKSDGVIARDEYSAGILDPQDDIDLTVDAGGNVHVIGCENDAAVPTAVFMTVSPTQLFGGSTAYTPLNTTTAITASACEITALGEASQGSGTIFTLHSASLTSRPYTHDATTITFTGSTNTTLAVNDIDLPDNADDQWIVGAGSSAILLRDPAGTADSIDLPSSAAPAERVTSMIAYDGILYVAFVDASGEVGVVIGDPEGDIADFRMIYPLDIPFSATDASVWVHPQSPDILLAAIVGGNPATSQLAIGHAFLN